ncbi:hypothetical protein KKC06_06810 [Patescibacteria group bacterium]|nr:hypothetical protein [Patescibacteria group bacterium]
MTGLKPDRAVCPHPNRPADFPQVGDLYLLPAECGFWFEDSDTGETITQEVYLNRQIAALPTFTAEAEAVLQEHYANHAKLYAGHKPGDPPPDHTPLMADFEKKVGALGFKGVEELMQARRLTATLTELKADGQAPISR